MADTEEQDPITRMFGENPPFIAAIERGDAGTVRRMLDDGMSIDTPGRFKRPATIVAADAGHVDVMRLLLDRGADANLIRRFTYNLDVATEVEGAITPLTVAAGKGHLDVVRLLLDRGADVRFTGPAGFTALTNATNAGHAAVCMLLIERGADVNARDALHDQSALEMATFRRMHDVVRLMLARGVRREFIDRARKLALHYGFADLAGELGSRP